MGDVGQVHDGWAVQQNVVHENGRRSVFLSVINHYSSSWYPDTGLSSRLTCPLRADAFERNAEAIDQSRSGEGLGQEANCPLPQRSGTSGLIGEGGDEYKRHAITLGAHHRQELQSAHAWHLQIRNHA